HRVGGGPARAGEQVVLAHQPDDGVAVVDHRDRADPAGAQQRGDLRDGGVPPDGDHRGGHDLLDLHWASLRARYAGKRGPRRRRPFRSAPARMLACTTPIRRRVTRGVVRISVAAGPSAWRRPGIPPRMPGLRACDVGSPSVRRAPGQTCTSRRRPAPAAARREPAAARALPSPAPAPTGTASSVSGCMSPPAVSTVCGVPATSRATVRRTLPWLLP